MNLSGGPVLLTALASLGEVVEDGSVNWQRTILGALGVLVVIALVIGIGQLMTGSARSSR
jgi:hypothetical protein